MAVAMMLQSATRFILDGVVVESTNQPACLHLGVIRTPGPGPPSLPNPIHNAATGDRLLRACRGTLFGNYSSHSHVD